MPPPSRRENLYGVLQCFSSAGVTMAPGLGVYRHYKRVERLGCLAPRDDIIVREYMSPARVLTSQWKVERRSTRLMLSVPVLVYGWATGDSPFTEITYTLAVNAHGGLLALTAMVQPGQMMLLVNSNTQEERQCRVVRVGRECDGERKVGFELMRPADRFWGLVYDSRQRLWQSAEPEREP